MAAVSRTDLLAWVNELLQLNYTKVEQCGTGAAYCQIVDSIYGDVPMTRVKMNAKHEYEFVANFKVLQNVFKAKKIDKPILIERLVKCKMQDNLEFLQWMKRFWDSNYGGQGYDPVARRRGASTDTPATIAPLSGPRSTSGLSSSRQPNEAVQNLQAQLREMSTHMEGLEKERDFYFAKLRDIEILVQQQVEALEAAGQQDDTLKEIQKILYSTEEGFEVPDTVAPVEEEETF
ncbi:calponin homology domain-containing protein [Butyriboletus roseoflavus]|nr:calponin homology domain-containing protein [Butyriboletus roseoflavus]